MIFDSHMHTELSTDSKMKIQDAIECANNKNIGIIITEHLDLDYPVENEFKCDVPRFFKEYEKYKSDNTLLGIEVGLTTNSLQKNEKIMNSYPFDYIIGSIHSIYDEDIFNDYVKNKIDERTFFQKYFDYMLECVKQYDSFDSLGHIDYIYRYAPYTNPQINLSWHKDTIAEIMHTLIKKDKVMELNTRRLNNTDSIKSLIEIYNFYKDLGGKYLTIGSDAHNTESIGLNFNIALDMLDSLELNAIYFKERKIEYF